MNALVTLWFYKIKSQIRNVFSKPASAIFTVLIFLLYGGIFVSLFFWDSTAITAGKMVDVHGSILLSIGFTAIMVLASLFSKRKALFFAADSFYLFSGPFTRKHIMRYLLSQTVIQSFLYAVLSTFVMVCLCGTFQVSILFYILIFLVNAWITFFFLMLTDYLYILSITDQKQKKTAQYVTVAFLLLFGLVFLYAFIQNDFVLESAFFQFLQSDAFHYIPVFGWSKWFLVSYVSGEWLMMGISFALFAITTLVLYSLFANFKGDFYEQAMEDSISFTKYYEDAKKGKSTQNVNKVKAINMDFKNGAWAIFSKGMLEMRKGRMFVRTQDLIVIVIYLAITYFMGLDYSFFMYMMLFYLFSITQDNDMQKELNKYYVYLIPAKPMAKLLAVVLPSLLKALLLMTIGMVAGGIVFAAPLMDIILYSLMMYGYTFVFMSASILSLRILRSRSNAMMENLMRMLVMLVCAAPGVGLSIFVLFHPEYFSMGLLHVISYSSLVLNFVVSLFLLYICKNMMNGREINSD